MYAYYEATCNRGWPYVGLNRQQILQKLQHYRKPSKLQTCTTIIKT